MADTDQTDKTLGGDNTPPSPGKKTWRRLLSLGWRCTLALLVLVTAALTAGRLLAPMLSTQQAFIEQQLSAMLGTPVAIGELEGSWYHLAPVIAINDLEIVNTANPDASHVVSRLTLKPSLADSFMAGNLVIGQVIVDNPQVELSQDASGRWTLAGLTTGDNDYTDAIIDFLLATGRMQIIEAGLQLHWFDGRELVLENIYIDLENTGNRHLARIQARVEDQPSPFIVQLDLTGDPRQAYSATAYLHTSQLEFSDYFSIEGLNLTAAQLSGDFWLTASHGMLFEVQADISALRVEGNGAEDTTVKTLALDNASLDLNLRHTAENHWQAWLSNIELDWQNRPWGAQEIYVELGGADQGQPLKVLAQSLDLAMVHDVVDDLLALPERGADVLADLSPRGSLANVVFNTDLELPPDNGFLLQANLADVAVDAWQGAPAASGVQGYVEASANDGVVELDSSDFDIHLPRLFTDSWHYDAANSRVYWSINDGVVRVNSDIIDVRNEYIHGHVQFDLYNHRDSGGEIQSELTLLIGVLEMDAGYKSLYLPTMDNIRNTMDWLDTALLAGNIRNSGFVSRTSTRPGAPGNSGTILSFYNVTGGELKFEPQWPALTGIDAFVMVDNNTAEVRAQTAEIEGIQLDATRASLAPDPEGGSWLTVEGSASAGTAQGIAFLRNTPVRNNIGDFIDEWQGEGNVEVDIDLGIALNNPRRQNDIRVNVLSNRSTLTIPEYSLSIDDLRGRVIYTSTDGLSASALSGRLFDFPIAATIEPVLTEAADGNSNITGTRVVGSGRASRNALQSWPGQPQFVKDILNFAAGEVDYLAEITIPNVSESGDTRLRLTSELLGLSMDMPPPFNKSVDNIRPLELLINFSAPDQWVSARFDNRVAANLRISGTEFVGGQVVFGPAVSQATFGPVNLPGAGLYFNGLLESYDYEAWEAMVTRFAEQSGANGAGQVRLEEYLSLVDVRIGRLNVIGQTLEQVDTRVRRSGGVDETGEPDGTGTDSWQVDLENNLLSGTFVFPDATGEPWLVDLDYLRFPEAEEPEDPEADTEDVDVLADVNPGELPDLDFNTGELAIGDKQLGAWEFRLRASGDSASISDLKMTAADARIRDNAGDAGANINWLLSDGMHTSSFTGLFSAGDLASVLPGWGYNANVESERAAFVSNLQWTGSPAAFALDKVIGNVQVDIRNGRFVDVDSGTSRLFGAFSFDSLVRRLQLDFSDLYERGMAYDDIRGRLDFNRGIVATQGAFEINGPSSQITIEGQINLVNETIDADMLVNVPLSQNLSVLAGILGAWPIAVSTYIASRIFEDQVDDFTTVLYRLEGPWENPRSGFEPSEEILEANIEEGNGEDTEGTDQQPAATETAPPAA